MDGERRLVLVEWVDSHGTISGWKLLEDCAPELLTARSVGWVLHETPDVLVLASHLVEPPTDGVIAAQYRGDMTIPVRAIVRTSALIPSAGGEDDART